MNRTQRRLLRAASVAAVAGLGLAMTTVAPHAYATGTAIPAGPTAATLGAQVYGDTDPATPEQVTFVLKMNGMPSLEAQVNSGMTSFLSVADFATRYGQSDANIAALTSYLGQFGIKTNVYANHINVSATGTAAQFNQALKIKQVNVKTKDGKNNGVVHVPKSAPVLPGSLSNMVTAVLGLSNYSPFQTQSVHVDPAVTVGDPGAAGDPTTCPLNVRLSACHMPADYADRYGVTPLYQQGYNGSGQTLAIVTLAALDEGAPEFFWQNYAKIPQTGRTVTVRNIDGGPGAPNDKAGTGETDLDVEQAGGVAPGANIVVYQAPNSDAGWVDAFMTAASDNTASSVSSSWGFSETLMKVLISSGWESPAIQAAYDEVFLELAAQGQSTFLSSADQGAYTATADLGSTDIVVDGPANSPFVTSAGGTTLPFSGTWKTPQGPMTVTVDKERAWGWDYLWPMLAARTGQSLEATAEQYVVGGGGGYSTVEPRPVYQNAIPGIGSYSAVEYLTPAGYQDVNGVTVPTTWTFNPAPPVIKGTGSGRVQPDVSANADPFSGYFLYEPSGSPQLQAGWGGTSFVAPQFNGTAAVMAQALGHRVGLWNPSLYKFALGGSSPVTSINTQGTANDNLFYSGTPGTLFNPAVGLGVPNFATYVADLRTK